MTRSIACKPVNGYLRRNYFKAADCQIHIGIYRIKGNVVAVGFFHGRSFHDIEQVELYAEYAGRSGNIPDGIEHHIIVFAGKTEDEMDDIAYTAGRKLFYGFVIDRQIIAAVYGLGGLFVYGLQSQFYP